MKQQFQSIQGARYSTIVASLRRISVLQYAYELRKNRQRRHFVESHIPKNGHGAELGVHKGFFTKELLDITEPSILYAVDPWYLIGREWEWSGGNRSTTLALRNILRRFEDEIVAEQLVVAVQSDIDFLQSLEDGHLDWAYIDSSHEYGHTVAELQLLESKVKSTGVIAGDDWQADPKHRHYGVAKAVLEFTENSNFTLTYSNSRDRQWAIQRLAE